ncbi:MAG: O-antigen ligase family protein [bacterium]
MLPVRRALLFLFPLAILLSNAVKIPLGGTSLSLSFPFTAAAALLLLITTLAGERRPTLYLPAALPLLGYLVVAIVSALKSSSGSAMSFGNAGAVPYLLFSLVCFLSFLNLIRDRGDLEASVAGLLAAGLIQVSLGLFAFLAHGATGKDLGTATLIDNKPAFAQFMLPVVLLALAKLRTTGLARPFWLVIMPAAAMLFLVVISRAAILGLVGAAALLYGRTARFWVTGGLVVGAAIALVVWKPEMFSETLYYSLRSFDIRFVMAHPEIPEVTSFYLRAAIFLLGFRLLMKSPLWGIGPGTFGERISNLPKPPFIGPNETLTNKAESGYFNALVESGFLGVLLLVIFFGTVAIHLLKTARRIVNPEDRALQEALSLSAVSLFLMNFAQESFTTTFSWWLLALALAGARVLGGHVAETRATERRAPAAGRVAPCGC